MTTEREAFEEFNYQLHGSSPFHIVYAKLENGRYVSPSIQYAWETWQARGEYESERTRKLVEALSDILYGERDSDNWPTTAVWEAAETALREHKGGE